MKQNSTKILEKNKTVRLYRYMRGCILEINHEGLKWARLPFCWSNLGVDNILWKAENSRIKRTWFWNRAWDTCCRACLFFFFFLLVFLLLKAFESFSCDPCDLSICTLRLLLMCLRGEVVLAGRVVCLRKLGIRGNYDFFLPEPVFKIEIKN